MDILQLFYFVNIVQSNFNLTLAAKKLHISQPALSQFLSNFERDNDLSLFYRKNGRLQALTEAGEQVYKYALEILDLSSELDEIIKYQSLRQRGTVRVGLPSLILECYFSEYFPQLALENAEMDVSITEDGSHGLRQRLIKGDLDMAIMIEPVLLDEDTYEQHIITIDEMVAFMSVDHELADKDSLEWSDLDDFAIATFNETFMTYQLVEEKLEDNQLDNQILFTSASWGYLMSAVQSNPNILTVLPQPVDRYLEKGVGLKKTFKDPIPFNFTICRKRQDKHEPVKDFVYNQIIEKFYEPHEELGRA